MINKRRALSSIWYDFLKKAKLQETYECQTHIRRQPKRNGEIGGE
jgi:hypothetical protein